MITEDGDFLVFSTGRRVFIAEGVVGLRFGEPPRQCTEAAGMSTRMHFRPNPERGRGFSALTVYSGYDDRDDAEDWTPEERQELAEAMCKRWQEWGSRAPRP